MKELKLVDHVSKPHFSSNMKCLRLDCNPILVSYIFVSCSVLWKDQAFDTFIYWNTHVAKWFKNLRCIRYCHRRIFSTNGLVGT